MNLAVDALITILTLGWGSTYTIPKWVGTTAKWGWRAYKYGNLIYNGAEALYLPTDNLIAANMPAIASVAVEAKIVVVCGEEGMLTSGGTITYSISYKVLGQMTGEMAVKILTGTPMSQVHSTGVDAS